LPSNSLSADLAHVLDLTAGLWEDFRGARLFLTGGTGFFGRWLLETFAAANDRWQLDAEAVVLSRNSYAFRQKVPALAARSDICFIAGDVRCFDFPEGRFSHVIHAATEASVALNDQQPLLMWETIVEGTRRVLDFACTRGACKILLTSSGAVYGTQPADITHITEDDRGAPDSTDHRSAYGEGKRAAELLCTLYARRFGLEPKIARCFAFVGPHLPLDIQYAVGNFIRDGLEGGPIRVNGDGTPWRSYLYAADLAVWLWTILFKAPPCLPYNVGSDHALTISEVARAVAEVFPGSDVMVAKQPTPGKPAQRYVPSVQRAKKDLGLSVQIDFRDALRRTVAWCTESAERARACA
jgi:dTDP-glucose 4,6-dehydratase